MSRFKLATSLNNAACKLLMPIANSALSAELDAFNSINCLITSSVFWLSIPRKESTDSCVNRSPSERCITSWAIFLSKLSVTLMDLSFIQYPRLYIKVKVWASPILMLFNSRKQPCHKLILLT